MRYLTAAELKLVMERGPESLDLTPAEIVEALALEVSEKRVAEASSDDAQLRAAAPALYHALDKVLEHVEDPDVERGGDAQCTLCSHYRKLARTALEKAHPARAEGRG